MLIGQLSERTGVHAHQLRYYEAQGLLEPRRRANGYRTYDDAALVTVLQIRRLLQAGLSTEEIRFLLPCADGTGPTLVPCAETLEMLQGRMRGLERQIATLIASRDMLREFIEVTATKVDGNSAEGCA